ncbi:MAG: DUF3347 domain-containing protein [Myxococcales bacterium]|nr:DUF3347 domain-containing protein [Myxococcales bacterium]
MMTSRLLAIALVAAALLTAPTPSAHAAGTAAFDQAMGPVLAQYMRVHSALASDKLDGVSAAAKRIGKLAAKVKPGTVTGKHKAHYASLPKKIRAAAKKLARAKSIDKARTAFKELSRPMAMWATMSKPTGVNVVFCSMAKGSWLQKSAKIRNPYYGAKMLACGQIIGGANQGKAGGHMKH